MEKKNYLRPVMQVEQFVPNQYIAACWIVHCNVGYGYGWVDSNDNNKLDDGEYLVSPTREQSQPGADGYYGTYQSSGYGRTHLSYVSGCGYEHEGVIIGKEGPTANAKWQNINSFGNESGSPYLVYAWSVPQGRPNAGGHATKITSAEWATNPNAS